MKSRKPARYDEGGEIENEEERDAETEAERKVAAMFSKNIRAPKEREVSVAGGGTEKAAGGRGRVMFPVGEGKIGVGLGAFSAKTPGGRISRLAEREISGEMPFLGGTLSGSYAYDPASKNKSGRVSYRREFNEGGKVSSASSRADGIAQRGKTKGRMI